jgi:predicted nucleic acid-binding protein
MPFVLDASVTACWVFRDEDHPHSDLALQRLRTDEAVAPSIWWFEVRNILVVNERRKRLAETDNIAFVRDLSRRGITLDRSPQDSEVLRLARLHRLSVYDAAYLELAQRHGIALATLDADLTRAARAEAVMLIGEGA